MSGFLRNIARRAAGLPAESTVAPALPPAILLEPPPLMESAAPAPVAVAVPAPVPAVSQASAPVIQRRAAPAAAPPVPATPMIAPQAALGPAPVRDSVTPIVAAPATPLAGVMQDSVAQGPAPGPITVEVPAPVPTLTVVETAAAIQPRPPADSPTAAVEQRTTIEHVNVLEVKPAAPAASEAPAPAPRPVEPARAELRPAISPVVEKTTRETVLQEIIERIYATEPAPLAPRIVRPAASPEPDHAPPQRSVEMQPAEPRPPAPPQRVELRDNGARAIATTPEKRTVNVRIGSVELKLAPTPAAAPPAPEPASGFEEFEEVRSYRF